MAINAVVHGGNESQWGILGTPTQIGQAAWGTPTADTVACEMFESKIPSVDPGVFRDNTVKLGDGRFRAVANDYASAAGGTRVISFSDMVVRGKDLGVLLYAVCQNMSEAVGTPFEKTLTIANATTQPNFSAGAGFFATIGIEDTIASFHRKYEGCILRTLTLSADLAGDGLLRASGEWISGFPEVTTANFITGVWAYNTQTHYNFHVTPTKKILGNDIVLYGFDITINNNAVRVGSSGATGECETYAIGTGDTGYEISGNIKAKFDANTQGIIAADRAGTTAAIQLACGSDGVLGNFDFTAASCLLQNVADDYDNSMGRALDIPFIANTSAVFTVSDALDRNW